jgi:hypothetical protein
VEAQKLTELRGATEGIRYRVAGGERQGGVDSAVALGDEMRSRWKRPRVETGEPP